MSEPKARPFSLAMDSTPVPTSTFIPSVSKLPIKRKTPDPNPLLPGPPPLLPPIWSFESPNNPIDPTVSSVEAASNHHRVSLPFKYHRIWTEADEIRFLRGLLDCGSQNLSFPRDLHIFYSGFCSTVPQPYTKSQLSEKLRRFRKKYRVISTRLAKGLDQSFLPPHDRSLYELSKQLWHPDYSKVSPFGGNAGSKPVNIQLISEVPAESDPILVDNFVSNFETNDNVVDNQVFCDVGFDEEVKLSEVNMKLEEVGEERGGQLGEKSRVQDVAAKAIMDVFDKCLKEVKSGLRNCVKKEKSRMDFERRWEEQRIAELEALGQRVKLVFEHSLLQS